MTERITLYSANASGTGAAAALALLCKMLAEKGALSPVEIEKLRLAATTGYDHTALREVLSAEEFAALERGREHIDSLWQSAALAAERQG